MHKLAQQTWLTPFLIVILSVHGVAASVLFLVPCFINQTQVHELVDGSCALTCNASVCPEGTQKLNDSPASWKQCRLQPWERALLLGLGQNDTVEETGNSAAPPGTVTDYDNGSGDLPSSIPDSTAAAQDEADQISQRVVSECTDSSISNCAASGNNSTDSTGTRETTAAASTSSDAGKTVSTDGAATSEKAVAVSETSRTVSASFAATSPLSSSTTVSHIWSSSSSSSLNDSSTTSIPASSPRREESSAESSMQTSFLTPRTDGLFTPPPSAASKSPRQRRDAWKSPEDGDCLVTCDRKVTVPQCCPGYYGASCEACPQSADGSICNKRGRCEDGIDGSGSCSCDDNYTGTACELCRDKTVYGLNCSEECRCVHGICDNGPQGSGKCRQCVPGFRGPLCDQAVITCNNLTCSSFSECQEIESGRATCVCLPGYESQPSNIAACTPINPCEKSSPRKLCGSFRVCYPTGPGNFDCRCPDGHVDDVGGCSPINPCLTNNGGCDEGSTACTHTGANTSECDCQADYENYAPGVGCSLKDACPLANCHSSANCTTIGPNKFTCSCLPGYVGDGVKNCFGNILDRLRELNDNHPSLSGQLSTALQLFLKLYTVPIRDQGPFTLFVPNNKAFRNVRKELSYMDMVKQPWRTEQILRQHMLIGQRTLEELQNFDQYYTLQGNVAELQVRGGKEVFRYRIRGNDAKAKVVFRDLPASNGIIHVVDELLIKEPVIAGDLKKTALELIYEEGRFNRLQTLISTLDVGHLFEKDNITVFAPENGGLDGLPEGALNYLITEEDGRAKLRTLLENHIFPGSIPVTDLINMQRIRSIANYAFDVSISALGRIQLNKKVNISQVNIPCKNAVYYHIDRPLIPEELDNMLPSRCDFFKNSSVKGRCSKCDGEMLCPLDSEFSGEIYNDCQYWGTLGGTPGCQPVCVRTSKILSCCPGFFGQDCNPCPGGFKSPCSGRGKCSDEIWGAGICICEINFRGEKCEQCLSSSMYGPNCTQPCSCIHGKCNGGPTGNGKCVPGTCYSGYRGENCELETKQCRRSQKVVCHLHAQCVELSSGQVTCECQPGYEGDGQLCTEVDPCSKPPRGNCHTQATCTKIGPGAHQCSCDHGWFGDGFFCRPVTPCNVTDHCHSNAQCINIQPGLYTCKCNEGYQGNGTDCIEIDGCLVNNGGCHQLSNCTATGPGEVNCTCPDGYFGDGTQCFTTIAGQVLAHDNLTIVARLLQGLDKKDVIVAQANETLTFFAPSDDAVRKFMAQQRVESEYFNDDVNVMTFFQFHTMAKDYTLREMLALEGESGRLETLFDGYSVRVFIKNNTVNIMSSQTTSATVIEGDVAAVNGHLHIIDSVLEPFVPDADQPFLREFFEKNPQFSEFGRWLEDKGLMTRLQSMDRYTLFVPDNSVFRPEVIKHTITTDYLKFYASASIILTPAVDNGQTVSTLLGDTHQLQFIVNGTQVYVNGVRLTVGNILTTVGVIHTISGLLHPVLNFCNKTVYKTAFGVCGPCEKPENLQCENGFQRMPSKFVQRNRCQFEVFGRRLRMVHKYLGCRVPCAQTLHTKQCCAGNYGEDCQECPGGPETPCGGESRGFCSDTLVGTGRCVCGSLHGGDQCQRCKDPDMAGNFCNISMNSCAFQNGNCSNHADCTDSEHGDSVLCRCRQGYVGDGYTCTPPCDIINGGCHANASCFIEYENKTVSCTCNDGFHGNGVTCQANVDGCTMNEGGCSVNADCSFTPPPVTSQEDGTVTCVCRRGYVGNGTLCVTSALDAISQISVAHAFYQDLNTRADADNVKLLLGSRKSTVTVFVPVNASVINMNDYIVEDMLVVGQDMTALNDSDINNFVTTISAKPLILTELKGQYFLNGSKLTDLNIRTINGFVNFLESPFQNQDEIREKGSFHSLTAILVPVVVILVILVFVIVAAIIVYHRTKATGFLDIVKRFRTGSDASMSFARLKAQESEDEVLPNPFTLPDNVNFDNPLYNDPEEIQ